MYTLLRKALNAPVLLENEWKTVHTHVPSAKHNNNQKIIITSRLSPHPAFVFRENHYPPHPVFLAWNAPCATHFIRLTSLWTYLPHTKSSFFSPSCVSLSHLKCAFNKRSPKYGLENSWDSFYTSCLQHLVSSTRTMISLDAEFSIKFFFQLL